MKITTKGQVTIPQEIRERCGHIQSRWSDRERHLCQGANAAQAVEIRVIQVATLVEDFGKV